MTTVTASAELLPGPISPELVLISPPEIARLARERLPSVPIRVVPVAPRTERRSGPRAFELAAVYLFCMLLTLGPLVFAIVSSPAHHAAT